MEIEINGSPLDQELMDKINATDDVDELIALIYATNDQQIIDLAELILIFKYT